MNIRNLEELTTLAAQYSIDASESIKRNNHMNNLNAETTVATDHIEAVLVDFLNFIGMRCGIDYGLYTRDLNLKAKEIMKALKIREDAKWQGEHVVTGFEPDVK